MSFIERLLSDPYSKSNVGFAIAAITTLVLVIPNVITHIRCFYLPFILDNKLVAKTSEQAVDAILKKQPTTYLKGQVAIVTGTTVGGIGAHTALMLAGRAGAHVVCAGRTMSKLLECQKYILKQFPDAKLTPMVLDVSSLDSVRVFVSSFNEEFPESKFNLALLVNNAGIMANPYRVSKDNLELQMATNHLGPFLLTNLLLPRLKKTGTKIGDARIINVASMAHALPSLYYTAEQLNKPYDLKFMAPVFAYGRSKRANIMSAKSLARKLKGTGVSAFSLCPGNVATNLGQNNKVAGILYKYLPIHKHVSQGAATSLHLALHPGMPRHSGKYFIDCEVAPYAWCSDSLCEEIWQGSLKLTKLTDEEIAAAVGM